MERLEIVDPVILPEDDVQKLIATTGAQRVAALRNMMDGRWKLGDLHGIHHWDRVLRNGLLLSEPGTDTMVVAYFAYLHDACRENDGEDPDHGPRAAALIDSLKADWLGELSEGQILVLQKAVAGHTALLRTGDPTVDACFDADRLDLIRSGIVPDPARMASSRGADLARQIQDTL